MTVLETERLRLRRMLVDDAEFILELVNEPSWLKHIGDRGVRTLDDARGYITKGPLENYDRLGYGLYLTQMRDSGHSIGICGLLKRDALNDADLGFAFLPRHWGHGYAHESAEGVVHYAQRTLGFNRLVAVTKSDNRASIKVLTRLAFSFEGQVQLTAGGETLDLYGRTHNS